MAPRHPTRAAAGVDESDAQYDDTLSNLLDGLNDDDDELEKACNLIRPDEEWTDEVLIASPSTLAVHPFFSYPGPAFASRLFISPRIENGLFEEQDFTLPGMEPQPHVRGASASKSAKPWITCPPLDSASMGLQNGEDVLDCFGNNEPGIDATYSGSMNPQVVGHEELLSGDEDQLPVNEEAPRCPHPKISRQGTDTGDARSHSSAHGAATPLNTQATQLQVQNQAGSGQASNSGLESPNSGSSFQDSDSQMPPEHEQVTLLMESGNTWPVKSKGSHLSSRDEDVSSTGSEADQSGTTAKKNRGSQLKRTLQIWSEFPHEIYSELAKYLCRDDVLNLRLVCRDFGKAISPILVASVVVPFGPGMYNVNSTSCGSDPPCGSMFEKYGMHIRKFGISFEWDVMEMLKAPEKTVSDQQSSWWGSYTWPLPVYPRFSQLQDLEKLADSVSLLKFAMGRLEDTCQLGLSVDSGHGWLNGPDLSDMAVFDIRCGRRARIFGQTFPAEDERKHKVRDQFFRHAQFVTQREVEQIVEHFQRLFKLGDLDFFQSLAIRSLDSFRIVEDQPDFDPLDHVGGADHVNTAAVNAVQQQLAPPPNLGLPAGVAPNQNAGNAVAAAVPPPAGVANAAQNPIIGPQHFVPADLHPQPQRELYLGSFRHALLLAFQARVNFVATHRSFMANGPESQHLQHDSDASDASASSTDMPTQAATTKSQYPLIFNGYNLAAEVGGWCHFIQRKVATPASFPLQPGTLTEAQAQWLLETVWAQRGFLSAYTTSILANSDRFSQVHSLHIGIISSGLLSSLEQREVWGALPALTTLTVLVSPDWRSEHIPGDQNLNLNMLVSPVHASVQFTNFLKVYIAPLEQLSDLVIGFVGGGEHATGIKARNQHILPAPISSAPCTWLSNHVAKPDPRTILTLSHIKHLTVQNAWFSPLMLEAFMIKARDTSLRTLTLDSVSLTAAHSQRTGGPLTNADNRLECVFPPSMWLYESLPTTHCWPATIDRITPGVTFQDLKRETEMTSDDDDIPQPPPSFRGFVSKVVFQSCGYVRISGVPVEELNQNDLVYPTYEPMDAGLELRAALLSEKGVMLSEQDPETGADWPLLGKLTQCIHPVEKRVLEQAWNMKFGWGDTLDRWAAVEDGCLEGGTGRFSGVITGKGGNGIDTDG